MAISLEEERSAFRRAHVVWNDGDIEGLLSLMSDDIVYSVNVDGIPYAASAIGKHDLRARLQILLDTFVIDAFVAESIVHEPEFSRSTVLGYYKHKKTGERLDIKVRFRVWMRDNVIFRMEENHDAAYIEAFERFVRYLGQTVEAKAAAG